MTLQPRPAIEIPQLIAPLVVAGVAILLLAALREPTRQRFSAIIIAGAGAAYISGGLGPWEFAFCAVMTVVAFRGLTDYRWIGAGWLMHSAWDVLHHLYGNPIIPIAPLSSFGCAVCDVALAVWYFAGAPSPYPWARARKRGDPMNDYVKVLERIYARFNARDIDGVLTVLTDDVAWANGMDGGYVHGREAVREYWTRQWTMVSPHVEPVGFHRTADGLRAAERAGAKTFVHISAAGVIMDDGGSPIRNADERAHTYPKGFSGYVASKAESEALVLAANKPAFRTIALRPPALWGPGDNFSKQLPHAISSGQFAFIDRGDYPFVTGHVDNVVEGIQRALEHGDGGRAFFIHDQETKTFREFVGLIAGAQGVSIDGVRSMPYWLAFLVGRFMEIFAALTRKKGDPPLSRSLVRMIGREFTVDDSAARRDLGYVGETSREDGRRMYVEAAQAAKTKELVPG
jgi:nucleoside-diphosphate-sugar epimerase